MRAVRLSATVCALTLAVTAALTHPGPAEPLGDGETSAAPKSAI